MIILASQSPRRAELLRVAGFEFTVRASAVDETPLAGELPEDYVCRLALAKASAVERAPGEIILGADTSVVLGGEILGKPADRADAIRMITQLAGRKHEVLTGVCLRGDSDPVTEYASTSVWFAALPPAEIEHYVDIGESMDKAGAYASQGYASRYIERIDGSYSNVVGLPVPLVWRLLRSLD